MASTGPLTAVLGALTVGISDREGISRRTGLPADTVEAALAHLRATGVVTAEALPLGCPDGGCSGCGTPTGNGCADGPTGGPILLTIRRERSP